MKKKNRQDKENDEAIFTGLGATGAGVMGAAFGNVFASPISGLVGAAAPTTVGGSELIPVPEPEEEIPSPTSVEPKLTAFTAGHDAGTIIGPQTPADDTFGGLKHEQIAHRAYRIYEDAGRPEGCAETHWAQAKRELSMI